MPPKASGPIDVIELGIVRDFREDIPTKTSGNIIVRELGIVSDIRDDIP